MSYTEIGQKVGMTSTSVIERIKRLEDSGIIKKYTIQIDEEKIGYPITAIIMLSCSGAYTPKEQSVIQTLSKYPQILECLRISGKNDFFIKLTASSMDDYKKINDEIGRYGQIDTSFVVSSFIDNPSITISKTSSSFH